MKPLRILALLAACGDNQPPELDDPGAPARVITGNHAFQYRALDKTLLDEEAIDLFSALVEVQVPLGEGWRTYPGTGHRDGSFEIHGVPEGDAWVRVVRRPFGSTFFWTSSDHVAFDETMLGPRFPDQANDGDRLRLELDGLAAWQDTDELGWFVPEDVVFRSNVVGNAPPNPGTTTITNTLIDWTGSALATAGVEDHAFVVQYRTQTLGAGLEVRAPFRAARPVIDQIAGIDGWLEATLTDPPILDYRFAWARDAFEAQRTAIQPTRTGPSDLHEFAMFALPQIVDGELWVAPELPLMFVTDPAALEGTTLLDHGTLAIPNPFPRDWVTAFHAVSFPVDFPLPDGRPATLSAAIGQRSGDLDATPVTPKITPIRAPRIAGRYAFAPLEDVGGTPIVSWNAPEVGTATSYQLSIIEGVTEPPEPFQPGWYLAATLLVPGDVTSVRVPAGVLREGATYGIIVRASAQPGQDVAREPFRVRGEAAFADAIVGPFTP